ncbi:MULTISPECIES: hypothetical protein, partial [unclassified Oceanispirochaeta]|uniref:hypothetical protein n=1 Tax=unclassified Oceanispirochaeta TaxID=2635722 RepID=UPI000E19EC45
GIFHSGVWAKTVRLFPELLSGKTRNECPVMSGIGVRYHPDSAQGSVLTALLISMQLESLGTPLKGVDSERFSTRNNND